MPRYSYPFCDNTLLILDRLFLCIVKRILILGGGFAGIECCLKLESYFQNNSEIEITLVSEDNFILFTPMLPQVASGTIETRHIVTPIRTLIKKTKFYFKLYSIILLVVLL